MFGNCHICGYEAKSEEEVRLWTVWGCCRTIVKKTADLTQEVELCAPNPQGGYYAPGTDPNTQVEDPEVFKELFCKKYEKKKKEEGKKDGNKS